MIEIKELKVKYQETEVLKGLNLIIKEGEFIFLNGHSGSGKSTFLKVLYRDVKNFSGEVFIEGSPIDTFPKYQTRRMIGTVFQNFELLERKTALENVKLAGEVLGRPERDIEKEALEILEKVGLKGKENRFPNQLSGGEQQRVAIARALLNKPKILLGDEPTGNLDPENAALIMELLKKINKEDRITMLIVTHSQSLIEKFPSRTITMEKGVVK